MATVKKAKAKNISAGPSKKTAKAPMVDPKGAYTKVQQRTLGKMKNGGIKKAQKGKGITPTYKNLPMGVRNEYYQITGENRDVKPTKGDSVLYKIGFERGLKGGKEHPYERNIEKMGRWEGQNYGKKKNKTGGVTKAKDGKWIQKAINPKHKGYCTPQTKATCTPKRKALAQTLRKIAKKK